MFTLFQTFLYPGDEFEQMCSLADLVFRTQVECETVLKHEMLHSKHSSSEKISPSYVNNVRCSQAKFTAQWRGHYFEECCALKEFFKQHLPLGLCGCFIYCIGIWFLFSVWHGRSSIQNLFERVSWIYFNQAPHRKMRSATATFTTR